MNNIVLIGAGQTGRGFLNRVLAENNINITFVDKNANLIQKLKNEKEYTISFGSQGRDAVNASNYEAYHTEDEQAKKAIENAELIIVSVGQKNLEDVDEYLKSMHFNQDRVDILTAENGVNVSRFLKNMKADPKVHVSEAIVFCTTLQNEGTLDIFSENYDGIPYDSVMLGHKLDLTGFHANEHFGELMQRKIFTYNCLSACIAYLGDYKQYNDYAAAGNNEEIVEIIQMIRKVLDESIAEEYGLSLKEQSEFSQHAEDKFRNRDIKDTIDRNVRDVDRKLGEKERILAPLQIIKKHQKESKELLLVLASALYYGIRTDTLVKPVDAYIQFLPQEWIRLVEIYLEGLKEGKSLREVRDGFKTNS